MTKINYEDRVAAIQKFNKFSITNYKNSIAVAIATV